MLFVTRNKLISFNVFQEVKPAKDRAKAGTNAQCLSMSTYLLVNLWFACFQFCHLMHLVFYCFELLYFDILLIYTNIYIYTFVFNLQSQCLAYLHVCTVKANNTALGLQYVHRLSCLSCHILNSNPCKNELRNIVADGKTKHLSA